MQLRHLASYSTGHWELIQESFELMTSRPYILQLFSLANSVLRAKRFYRRHSLDFISPDNLLGIVSKGDVPIFHDLLFEYRSLERRIRRSKLDARLPRRRDFGLTREEGFALYLTVRASRPDTVLESGVANGFSTRVILEALVKNGHGFLVSTEIDKNVGALVEGFLRPYWTLKVGKPGRVLLETIDQIGSIDIFLHDSDHRYDNALFEFCNVYPRMSAKGLILSDDVELSLAFLDFAKKIGKRPLFLYGFRKILGVISL